MSTSGARYHHGDLRAALVAAALPLLREVGPAGLSLRAVARAAGVSAMAPYRHFRDKDALLAAVATHGFALFAARLEAALAAASGARAALIEQGVAYVTFACAERALFRLMFGPLIAGAKARATLHQGGAPAYAALERAVAAMVADPARRPAVTLSCWSVAHGLACLLVDGQVAMPAETDAIAALARSVLEQAVPP